MAIGMVLLTPLLPRKKGDICSEPWIDVGLLDFYNIEHLEEFIFEGELYNFLKFF